MTHIDEFKLEMYALNAELPERECSEIEEHMQRCEGCRSLFGEISGFYEELDKELGKPEEIPETTAPEPVRALVTSRRQLAFWEERLALSPFGGWASPFRRMRALIRRHPVVTVGATFAFSSLAVMGLMTGYNRLTEDVNPAYAGLNSNSGFFEVYNKSNNLLWKRLSPDFRTSSEQPSVTDLPRYAIHDIDGDGREEVLTTLSFSGLPPVPGRGLHVFDGRGGFHDIQFERRVTFRGTPYELPAAFQGGSMVLIDSTGRGGPELYVTAKNDRSPNAFVRMNNRGEVIGEYWHQGQFIMGYLTDLDGDGRKELVTGGFNDVDDQTEPSYPFIVVLDPQKIVGRQESQVTPGYGYRRSDAELYYVRLPLTEFNTFSRIGAGVSRLEDFGDRLSARWGFTDLTNVKYDLEFVFSKSFEPIRVISTTGITQFFDRELAQKHVTTRLDDAYLDYLKSQIRFWDGRGWSREVVKVASDGGG